MKDLPAADTGHTLVLRRLQYQRLRQLLLQLLLLRQLLLQLLLLLLLRQLQL